MNLAPHPDSASNRGHHGAAGATSATSWLRACWPRFRSPSRIFVVWYVDNKSRELLHIHTPIVGIVIAIAAIYLLGVFVTSVIGRFLLATHRQRAPAGARAARSLPFVEAGGAGRHAGRHLLARGAGARRRRPRLRPRLHQRPLDRGRSGAVVRVRAGRAQPDDGQALLRPDHALHPPGDEHRRRRSR